MSDLHGQGLEARLKVLYPRVDESETPLPKMWSTKDKYTYIGLSQNNLRVQYKGMVRPTVSVISSSS